MQQLPPGFVIDAPRSGGGADPVKVRQEQRADEDQGFQRNTDARSADAAARAAQAAILAERNAAIANQIKQQDMQMQLATKGLMLSPDGKIIANPDGPIGASDNDKGADAKAGAYNSVIQQIDRLYELYNNGPGATKGASAIWDYLPTDANAAFDTAGAALGDQGNAAFKVPGMGAQSDSDAARFVAANQPSASDRDVASLEKLRALRQRLENNMAAQGLPAPVWNYGLDGKPVRGNQRDELGIQIDPAMLSQTPGGGDPSLGQVGGPLYGDINQPLGGASDAQVTMGDAIQQGRFNGTSTEMQAGATDENIVTPQDQAIAARLSKLWRGGASYDQLMQEYDSINQEYGYGGRYKPSVSGAVLKQQARLPGRERPGFDPVATGRKSDAQNFKDGLLDTDIGAGFLSYLDSAGFGLTDEVAGLMGGENAAQQAQFSKEYLANNHPISSTLGSIGGGLTAVAALQKGVNAGAKAGVGMLGNQTARRTAARLGGNNARAGATANVLYGTGYGAGSDNQNRLRGAGIGAVASKLGDFIGQGVTKGVGRLISGVSNPAVRNLTEQGVPLSLGQTLGNRGMAGRLVQKLESIPVVGDMAFGNKLDGMANYNRAEMGRVADIVGAPSPKTGGEAGLGYLQGVENKAYGDALGGLNINPDDQFTSQFGQAMSSGRGIPTKGEEFGAVVDRSIAPLFSQENGALTGESLQQALQTIRANRSAFGKDGAMGGMVADQFSTMDDALTGLMQRQAPDRFPMYQKANEMHSNLMPIQDAMISANRGNGAESIFTPRQLQAAITNNTIKYGGRGAAALGTKIPQLTRDAMEILPQTVPDSGTTGRALASLALPAALGGTAYGVQDISPASASVLAMLAAMSTKTGSGLIQKAAVKRGPKSGLFGQRVKNRARLVGQVGAVSAVPLIQE